MAAVALDAALRRGPSIWEGPRLEYVFSGDKWGELSGPAFTDDIKPEVSGDAPMDTLRPGGLVVSLAADLVFRLFSSGARDLFIVWTGIATRVRLDTLPDRANVFATPAGALCITRLAAIIDAPGVVCIVVSLCLFRGFFVAKSLDLFFDFKFVYAGVIFRGVSEPILGLGVGF